MEDGGDGEHGELFQAASIIWSFRNAEGRRRGQSEDPDPEEAAETELIYLWGSRRKRSRRAVMKTWASAWYPYLSSGLVSSAKGKLMRASPASPIGYSGCSATSTSGGDDEKPNPGMRRSISAVADGICYIRGAAMANSTTIAGEKFLGGQQLPSCLQLDPPLMNTLRSKKKKMKNLPEMREEVRSLMEENAALRKEAAKLRNACKTLSNQNSQILLRLQTTLFSTMAAPATGEKLQQEEELITLPDLNLPVHEDIS